MAASEQPKVNHEEDVPGVLRTFGSSLGRVDGDVLAVCEESPGVFLSIEEGGMVRRWDAATAKQIHKFETSELESCWRFDPKGQVLAGGGPGISIWDVETETQIERIEDSSWTLAIAFHPVKAILASGHDDSKIRIWDLKTGQMLTELSGHMSEVCALAFSDDGKQLASAGEDRRVGSL